MEKTVKGAVRITEEHGFWCFHRYSKSQEKYYEFNNWDFYRKCYATAGVRFDFYTDSRVFGFDYELHAASSRHFCYFDAFVDGVLTDHIGIDRVTDTEASLDLILPPGKKRVTVWFPCLFGAMVKNVAVDDGSSVEEVGTDKRLLMIGDSITHGYDARYPSKAYPAIVAREMDVDVVNQGIGGDVYHVGNLGDGVGFTPDLITVLLGTNDWSGRKKDHFFTSLEEYYEKLDRLYPDVKKAVITPLWRGDNRRITDVGLFKDAVKAIASEALKYNGVTVIDGEKLIDHRENLFSPDILHPNDAGFENLAPRLISELKKILK